MRVSAEEKKATTARIVDVAERQIAEFGLSSLNLRDLAKAADIKPASLYNHYSGGLDEVVLKVNSRTIKILDDLLADAANACDRKNVAVLFEKLAIAYLHFAIDYPKRFGALFEHQMKDQAPIPDWHLQEHYNLFRHVERPLDDLNHDLGAEDRRTLARTIYSAVHGVVQLGLQGRMIALPVPVIEKQLRIITKALATGFSVEAADLSNK